MSDEPQLQRRKSKHGEVWTKHPGGGTGSGSANKQLLHSDTSPVAPRQALQPDFPQQIDMREISADEHEPDSPLRCNENYRCSRNAAARRTSQQGPALLLLSMN
ncbi:hypothetical protein TREES_T100014027 [Tupaia chinensis]|uniref:Uncharacterized protein n=1 Tax=Tupaia chinensis TaxID=246437 RepID=L9KTG8_TUPCH|nr:hypothetical protein TREES_T100014027 [Tupaia chinensis]